MAELIAEIARLSVTERLLLVQEILHTISQDETELTAEQRAEIISREQSISQRTVKTITWSSIQGQIATRYGLPN
ncbi:MAG: addiction module protein [Saprospiraceae bacterium]